MLLCCTCTCVLYDMCLCTCAHVPGIECTNICPCIWKPEQSLGVLGCPLPYLWRKGLFLNLNLTGYMRQASRRPSESCLLCSCLPRPTPESTKLLHGRWRSCLRTLHFLRNSLMGWAHLRLESSISSLKMLTRGWGMLVVSESNNLSNWNVLWRASHGSSAESSTLLQIRNHLSGRERKYWDMGDENGTQNSRPNMVCVTQQSA